MKKSFMGFILGLIFSLIGIASAYVFWLVFVFINYFNIQTSKKIRVSFHSIGYDTNFHSKVSDLVVRHEVISVSLDQHF